MNNLLFLEGTGGEPDLTILMWLAFGFFLLMVVVGWWAKKHPQNDDTEKAPHEEAQSHH